MPFLGKSAISRISFFSRSTSTAVTGDVLGAIYAPLRYQVSKFQGFKVPKTTCIKLCFGAKNFETLKLLPRPFNTERTQSRNGVGVGYFDGIDAGSARSLVQA